MAELACRKRRVMHDHHPDHQLADLHNEHANHNEKRQREYKRQTLHRPLFAAVQTSQPAKNLPKRNPSAANSQQPRQ